MESPLICLERTVLLSVGLHLCTRTWLFVWEEVSYDTS
jgi:hypothetical protein